MQTTKYDLCADEVTLDYEELIRTAKIAVAYSKEALNTKLGKWYSLSETPSKTNAEWMLRDAGALAIATRTLYYLTEGKDRSNIVVVRESRDT